MNIITDGGEGDGGTPYVVGTPNATEDVYRHVKPGRKRANFFRYFRFNLPRLTKAILVLTILVIGGAAGRVALSGHLPFPHADIALWIIVFLAAVYVIIALVTRLAIWDYGSMISAGALIVYLGGVLGDAPYVWNGASLYLAATWNLLLFVPLLYFVLNWAVNFGILVAWPKTQGFTD